MSRKELQRYRVINKAIEERQTTAETAESLGLSMRHVFRLKSGVKETGAEGMMHGNQGRCPATPERSNL